MIKYYVDGIGLSEREFTDMNFRIVSMESKKEILKIYHFFYKGEHRKVTVEDDGSLYKVIGLSNKNLNVAYDNLQFTMVRYLKEWKKDIDSFTTIPLTKNEFIIQILNKVNKR